MFKSCFERFFASEAVRVDRLPSRLDLPQILLSSLLYSIQAISLLNITVFKKRKRK